MYSSIVVILRWEYILAIGRIMRQRIFQHPLIRHCRSCLFTRYWLRKTWHKNGRKCMSLNPHVMIRVDAHVLLLCSKRELTNVQSLERKFWLQTTMTQSAEETLWSSLVVMNLELMMGLEIWPTPHPAIDHVGESFSMRHLQSVVLLFSSIFFVGNVVTCSRPSRLLGIVTHLLGWPGQLNACSRASIAPCQRR